jgi:hypothetical protein
MLSKSNNNKMILLDNKHYKSVLSKLYKLLNLQKYRYQIINNISYLEIIKKYKHYITPHFVGYNFLFFVCFLDNIKYNLLISKKELKYFENQNILNDIKIYTIESNNSFNEIILDGKYIIDKSIFIIQDIYYDTERIIHNINLKERLIHIDNILNTKVDKISNQLINFKIIRLYEYDELPDLLYNKLKKSELKVNGLIFYPNNIGKYYIYTNDTEFEELKHKNVIITSKYYDSETEFVMKKTNLPDVYEIYYSEDNNLIKEGIAHIPNIKISHYLKNIFKNKNMININCIKSNKFNKWIPICDDYIDYSEYIF